MLRDMEPPVMHNSETDLILNVLCSALPPRRKISECVALLSLDSSATIDPEFAKDVEVVIAAHREPLEPPAWD